MQAEKGGRGVIKSQPSTYSCFEDFGDDVVIDVVVVTGGKQSQLLVF